MTITRSGLVCEPRRPSLHIVLPISTDQLPTPETTACTTAPPVSSSNINSLHTDNVPNEQTTATMDEPTQSTAPVDTVANYPFSANIELVKDLIKEADFHNSIELLLLHMQGHLGLQIQIWNSLVTNIGERHHLPLLDKPEAWIPWLRILGELMKITKSHYLFANVDLPQHVLNSSIHQSREAWWYARLCESVPLADSANIPSSFVDTLVWIGERLKPDNRIAKIRYVSEFLNLQMPSGERPVTKLLDKYRELTALGKALNNEYSDEDWKVNFVKVLGNRYSDYTKDWYESDKSAFTLISTLSIKESNNELRLRGNWYNNNQPTSSNNDNKDFNNSNKRPRFANRRWTRFDNQPNNPPPPKPNTPPAPKDNPRSVKSISDGRTKDVWCLDTGSEVHVSNRAFHFGELAQPQHDLITADGTSLNVIGMGDVEINTSNGKVKLFNVHLVPEAPNCLISPGLLHDQGFQFDWQNDRIVALQSERMMKIEFLKNNRLWSTKATTSCIQAVALQPLTNPDIIHRRLVHLSASKMKKVVPNLNFNHDSCKNCLSAKLTKIISHEKQTRADAPFDRIHIDIAGGIDALPEGWTLESDKYIKVKYLLLFTDDHSRYRWAYFLNDRKNMDENLEWFIRLCQNQYKRTPKCFRSDGAREFESAAVEKLFNKHGIIREPTAAYCPQQNGVAERSFRTIFNYVRACIDQTNLPSRFWPEVVRTVLHVINKIPLTDNKSAYELIHQTPPNISYFRAFGSTAYVYDYKNKSKLAQRARRMFLVGYEHKNCFRVIDPDTMQVQRRRDVVIREDELFVWPSNFSEPTQYAQAIQLKLPADSDPEPFPIPNSYTEAVKSPQAEQWRLAMDAEVAALHTNNTWNLAPKPTGKILRGRWVYRVKEDGRFKARWVVKGYLENELADRQTYAHVTHITSLRILLTMAAINKWTIVKADVSNAFLKSDIDRTVFVELPHGYTIPGQVAILMKSLYGLRTAPRSWMLKLRELLGKLDFFAGHIDEGIFYHQNGSIILTYVDDLLFMGSDPAFIESAVSNLNSLIDIKRLPFDNYLGMIVKHVNDRYILSHENKIDEIVDIYDVNTTALTPAEIRPSLGSDLIPADLTKARSLLGSLLHLSAFTRPDISFAVTRCANAMAKPTEGTMKDLLRIVAYLKKTATHGIQLGRLTKAPLVAFCDATWATNVEPRSYSGHILLCFGSPVLWVSRRQRLAALSTCEAEYISATTAVQNLEWARRIYAEINQTKTLINIPLHIDNKATIRVAESESTSMRSRHFLVRDKYLREAVALEVVTPVYTPTAEMVADGLTKALGPILFDKFVGFINLFSPSDRV